MSLHILSIFYFRIFGFLLSFENSFYIPGVSTGLVHSGCNNKVPHTGYLINKRNLSLTVLETGSLSSGCQHDWLLVRNVFLVSTKMPSFCLFTLVGKEIFILTTLVGEELFILIILLIRTLISLIYISKETCLWSPPRSFVHT